MNHYSALSPTERKQLIKTLTEDASRSEAARRQRRGLDTTICPHCGQLIASMVYRKHHEHCYGWSGELPDPPGWLGECAP